MCLEYESVACIQDERVGSYYLVKGERVKRCVDSEEISFFISKQKCLKFLGSEEKADCFGSS